MTNVASKSLSSYLVESTKSYPDRIAVVSSDGDEYSYNDLNKLAINVSQFLASNSVNPGDRVGILLQKSTASLAAMFGTLYARAAYVPVDCKSPVSRAAYIFDDCEVKVIFVEKDLSNSLSDQLVALGRDDVVLVEIESTDSTGSLLSEIRESPSAVGEEYPIVPSAKADDLAYILYTSGSTGLPKGVPLTHRNACAFVDWCNSLLKPTAEDRFSSHAPFHFDLSILDVYTCIRSGSALILIGEHLSKEPAKLARYIETQRITIWYSAPSILTMMNQTTELGSLNYSSLRLILFAGEDFPVKHLRKLMLAIP
ncbi:MAG: non-ribosomal peptide synthetase component F, partial [Candidatus Azotimanducaceae bacterium]